MTAIECVVDDADLLARVAGMIARTEDVSPAWPGFADAFAEHEARVFDTLGATIGETWSPLSPPYAAWKTKVRPGRPTLVFDGDLRDSLTNRPLGVEEFRAQEAEVGTDDHTAEFHQYGTRHMPARPMVGANAVLAAETARLLANWITDAQVTP